MLSKPWANHCSKIIVRWDSACCVFIQCRHSLFNCCLYSVFIHLSTVSWYNYVTWLQYFYFIQWSDSNISNIGTSTFTLFSIHFFASVAKFDPGSKKKHRKHELTVLPMLTSSPQLSGQSIWPRGQGSNPGAGNLVVFVSFLFFSSFFILADNKSLYVDTHIIPHRIGSLVLFKM